MAHTLHEKKFMVNVLLHEDFIVKLEGDLLGEWWTK